MKMEKTKNIFICNTSGFPQSSKSNNLASYLDKIVELGGEFEKLEAFSTAGDIRPPYPYQWRATTKLIDGDDDSYEGIGESPLEAIRNLYKSFKAGMTATEEDEPNG